MSPAGLSPQLEEIMTTGTVLDRILSSKRESVRERKAAQPLDIFSASLRPSRRRLREAFRPGRTAFILECKKASPSRGLIRPDYDPVALAGEYAPVADAISVLADGPFFQGSLEDVRRVRESTRLPVLSKDFVVDPYQVFEARLHGADAVLLMLSVLDDAQARVCLEAARGLGMDGLVEVHTREELTRALDMGADLVGINNRDFTTLETDLSVTEDLAPLVPSRVTLVCESGIRSRADVERLRPLVDGFLVGTSLVESASPGLAARELVCGRVKICGLTSPEDAGAAWRAGALYGGLVFHGASPRNVTLERARAIRSAAPLRWVGVFVDAPVQEILTAVSCLSLDVVQLHGDEDVEHVARLREGLPSGVEIWKAHRVGEERPALPETGADRILLDAFSEGCAGGTGTRFDWSLLQGMEGRERVVLAGGLDPAHARRAAALGTWALDLSSGVESAPGHKDVSLLREFFEALRGGSRGAGRVETRSRGRDMGPARPGEGGGR